jgi:hypothetical protein
MSGNLQEVSRTFHGALFSTFKRAAGALALGALVALARNAAFAGDARATGATATVQHVAVAPADAASPAPPATAASPAAGAPSGNAIHDRAGGKPVAIVYDTSSFSYPGIKQAVEESVTEFASKFSHRFNVETQLVPATIKSSKDVDDAVKASGALLGTRYGASAHGEPRGRGDTQWSFLLETKFRDANGTVWIDVKKELDTQYKALSDYHAITLSALSDLNDQVIEALAKESAK